MKRGKGRRVGQIAKGNNGKRGKKGDGDKTLARWKQACDIGLYLQIRLFTGTTKFGSQWHLGRMEGGDSPYAMVSQHCLS